MTNNNGRYRSHSTKATLLSGCLVILAACSSIEEQERLTLRSIDIRSGKTDLERVFVKPKSDQEIRAAYYDYIKTAKKSDNDRLQALNRLAELESEIGEQQKSGKNGGVDELNDSQYIATINRTIELLTTSLADYPKAKGNDKLLHQLAEAYEKIGQRENSVQTLKTLTAAFPRSPFYSEAQFRLGEHFFIIGDYIDAEDAYTEVIITPGNDIFYEKSLFKRGWSRYKQQLYLEAVDDYLDAVTNHDFDELKNLDKSEKDQFDEYFRAIGLAFSFLGGAASLKNYFANNTDFKYLYHTYAVISDIYLKQERYSDAAETLEQFNQQHNTSKHIPESRLKIIEIWQASPFNNRLYAVLESFYIDYNPASPYWQTQEADSDIGKKITHALREYVVMVAEHFHDRYRDNNKRVDFTNAERWYKRYLQHYSSYARQDNIFNLYAELLYDGKRYRDAMPYFELAAYDGDIILDKAAAYATITLSQRLYRTSAGAEKEGWLNKHLRYATTFSQLYPTDTRTGDIIIYAAELAFVSKQYKQAISIAGYLPQHANAKTIIKINEIRAQAYVETKQHAEAEAVYQELAAGKTLTRKQQQDNQNRLALSIYQQAEQAKAKGNMPLAAQEYMRAAEQAPQSGIATTAIYDAVAIAMTASAWMQAIDYITIFKQRYPTHPLNTELSKKLSVAYLQSDQGLKAAKEFERISTLDNNRDVKMAALLQAADLYETKKDWNAAIRSYRDYANTFPEPFAQQLEAMEKLVSLYTKTNEPSKIYFWQNKIYQRDRKTARPKKTERTKYIASKAILGLAREKQNVFERRRLVEPLQQNLRMKKKDMQAAVRLYGQASIYGLSEITTEATHAIGEIYREFSIALLDSQRPKSLNDEELEQYEILLEDQAFPFEEKAIEFYETNLRRSADDVWNQWIRQSFTKLVELFPARYKREGKTEVVINDIN